jgi:hypothetical protein
MTTLWREINGFVAEMPVVAIAEHLLYKNPKALFGL